MGANKSPWIMNVQEADFETQVIQKSKEKPVVVDFWAPWCRPCLMLAPLLEKAVTERNGEVLLAKINTDENQGLARQFQISSIPTVIAFRDGRPAAEFTGVLPEEHVRQFLSQIMPSAAEHLARQAADLEKGQPAQAEVLYRQALEQDSRLDKALLGLARVLIAQKKEEEARGLLENAAVATEFDEEAERLKGILVLRELARSYGDEASTRRRQESDPDNPQLRYELGCILAAAGNYREALEMLLSAGERDPRLATSQVRETMVKIFHVIGNNSDLANAYRQRLTALLY